MGREVRMVPPGWEHPKDERGHFRPLLDGYRSCADAFMQKANAEGLQEAVDYFGRAPNIDDYMPEWSAEEATHFMMYETITEGTPISPAFATPEQIARWLADTGANAGAGRTASYDAWLRVAQGGYACSMALSAGRLVSGVEAFGGDES